MCADADVISNLKWCREKFEALENPSEPMRDASQTECLNRLDNIVPHHCGMHESCQSDTCDFVKLSKDHPDWDAEQLDAECDKTAHFNGEHMSLSEKGMKAVQNAHHQGKLVSPGSYEKQSNVRKLLDVCHHSQ